jgi:hypothetical protein
MEIDADLYHSSGTPNIDAPRKQSLKAKKPRVSADAAKATGGTSDKVQTALVVVEKGATLEVDDQLCTGSAKEELSAKKGKGSTISTSRGKRVHGASTKLKSKKTKKAPLVVYESEDTATVMRLPEFRNRQNQVAATKSSLPDTFTGAKEPSEINHPLSPALPSIIAQSPDRAHCSREGGRGSTTPTYGEVVMYHRTPKAQCSSNSETTTTTTSGGKELPAISPCRPLSRVGKDHPPSYIGSGLSKTQLVSYMYDKI